MSLDIYLIVDKTIVRISSGLFIRQEGRTVEISRKEWDKRYPGTEPAIAVREESNVVWWGNITHNLNTMADKAGIYEAMWAPEEIDCVYAGQILGRLIKGLRVLETHPQYYKQFNPPNGWGSYDRLVDFVKEYIAACQQYPEARISVSR